MKASTVIILIVLLLVAAVLNPSFEEYYDHITNQLRKQENNNKNIFVKWISKYANSLSITWIKNNTVRDNCIIFSIYKTRYLGSEFVTLGIFGTFITL
ncbi:DUF4359 domain-containing protein [bacterium]|nr:DUF4359 domain-containing protein [bacterium]